MSNKGYDKLTAADQMIRRMPGLPGLHGMFDGTLLTIKFVRGFEIFNTRPYHNYEDWGDGYYIETHDGMKGHGEDLDDALADLRMKLIDRIRKAQGALADAAPGAEWVLGKDTMGTVMMCAQVENGGSKTVTLSGQWIGRPHSRDARFVYDRRNEDGTPHLCDACKEKPRV